MSKLYDVELSAVAISGRPSYQNGNLRVVLRVTEESIKRALEVLHAQGYPLGWVARDIEYREDW